MRLKTSKLGPFGFLGTIWYYEKLWETNPQFRQFFQQPRGWGCPTSILSASMNVEKSHSRGLAPSGPTKHVAMRVSANKVPLKLDTPKRKCSVDMRWPTKAGVTKKCGDMIGCIPHSMFYLSGEANGFLHVFGIQKLEPSPKAKDLKDNFWHPRTGSPYRIRHKKMPSENQQPSPDLPWVFSSPAPWNKRLEIYLRGWGDKILAEWLAVAHKTLTQRKRSWLRCLAAFLQPRHFLGFDCQIFSHRAPHRTESARLAAQRMILHRFWWKRNSFSSSSLGYNICVYAAMLHLALRGIVYCSAPLFWIEVASALPSTFGLTARRFIQLCTSGALTVMASPSTPLISWLSSPSPAVRSCLVKIGL